MFKVSVIIPVYNASNYIKFTIESILKQSLDEIEMIFIDDGSTDNSLSIINDYKDYDNIKIITQKNQGPGVARNVGIQHASSEYIAFLDSDDIYVDKDSLKKMYEFGKKNDADVVAANLKFIEPDYTIVDNPHYPAKDYAFFDDYGEIDPKDYGIPYAFYKNIYKKEFLIANDIRFPDFYPGEDPIFMANVLVNAKRIFVVPCVLYGYNHSIGGGVNKKIDTFEKKKKYMEHFKIVADILKQGGLQHTSDFYKIHLFRYLNFEKNNEDPELFELFNDIYGLNNEGFDKTDFNYIKFNILMQFYYVNKSDSEEFYRKINKKFLTFNIYNTMALNEEIIDKYLLMVYSYSLDNFKSNYKNYLMNNRYFKREFLKFKIEKFLFNLNINRTGTVFNNTKMIITNNNLIDIEMPKSILKQCYKILFCNSIEEFF